MGFLIDVFKIARWHKKTFPKYEADRQIQKICEESIEFQEAYFFKDSDEALEEAADVIIASIGAMRFKDIRELVNKKMKKNRRRVWKNGHHIEVKK